VFRFARHCEQQHDVPLGVGGRVPLQIDFCQSAGFMRFFWFFGLSMGAVHVTDSVIECFTTDIRSVSCQGAHIGK
jgi:hypothetical protein